MPAFQRDRRGARVQFAVENLRETAKNLKRIDSDLPKRMKNRIKALAESTALPLARKLYGDHYATDRKHSKKMKVKATARGDASLSWGGVRIPEAGGQEHGSDGRWPQFSEEPRVPDEYEGGHGRFLWKAGVDTLPEFSEGVQEVLTDLLREAGFKKGGVV